MINTLANSFRTIIRVLKNAILRPFRVIGAKIKTLFNVNKVVTQIPGIVKKVPEIFNAKPEKRRDYFDWKYFYIAKKLIFLLVILAVTLPLLIIYVLVPVFTRWFGTKNFVIGDSDLGGYNGKVIVYYDDQFKQVYFNGTMKDGQSTKTGREYYETGTLKYDGSFETGQYSGQGKLYYEDGTIKYDGGFLNGVYEGNGVFTDESGEKYSGTYEKGTLQGSGTIIDGNVTIYDGNFIDGKISGEGKIYNENGTVKYSGMFSDGILNGEGSEYDENGNLIYSGGFSDGLYNGNGIVYSRSGKKIYSGNFERGVYSGSGTLYDSGGKKLYSGDFEDGLYSGNGTLYRSDGSVVTGAFENGEAVGLVDIAFKNGIKYEGILTNGSMNGKGVVYSDDGDTSYTGLFKDNDIDFGSLLAANIGEVKTMFDNNLTQTVEGKNFYLECAELGVTVKCIQAVENSPAAVVEIYSAPIVCPAEEISSAADISSAAYSADKKCPAYAAEKYLSGDADAECYAVDYDNYTVFWWVQNGKLAAKTAEKIRENSSVQEPESPSTDNESSSEITDEELKALFEEVGLDISDFTDFVL